MEDLYLEIVTLFFWEFSLILIPSSQHGNRNIDLNNLSTSVPDAVYLCRDSLSGPVFYLWHGGEEKEKVEEQSSKQ